MSQNGYEAPKIMPVGQVTELTAGQAYAYKDAGQHSEKSHKHSLKKRRTAKPSR